MRGGGRREEWMKKCMLTVIFVLVNFFSIFSTDKKMIMKKCTVTFSYLFYLKKVQCNCRYE